ncbi:phosphotransferase enzyme family protein [Puia sp.]|uniref:phosphotransferase enzyme family protein n=1 Tax=Puia sp. TaxID=2045100 RepID=UPI002F4061B6
MTSIFPCSYSTLSPAALAIYIGERYSFDNARCRFLVRGVGDTYQLDTPAARFILRVYRPSHRSYAQITAEVELLLVAKNAGVSLSYPIADSKGQFIQKFNGAEGERHAVLFSFARGNPVAILNKAQLQNLGRQLARFHNVSSTVQLSDNRWTFDPAATLTKPLETMRPYFADLPEEYAWWRQAAEKTIAHLTQTDTTAFSTGFCHFDLLPKNFHFEGDELTLFDFDFFGYGWLINDLMTFRVHLDLDVHFGRLTREAADQSYDSFLTAYREVRTLPDAEAALVPWLALGWWCFYMDFHSTHDQFYPLVQPSQLKMRTALIRRLTPLATD